MRVFSSGACRDDDGGKLDFEGYFSPLVMERRARYMFQHGTQADGKRREADNWQKGIPLTAYMKSGFRHFFDWWKGHRGLICQEDLEEALCAVCFNAEGYLFELLKRRSNAVQDI